MWRPSVSVSGANITLQILNKMGKGAVTYVVGTKVHCRLSIVKSVTKYEALLTQK